MTATDAGLMSLIVQLGRLRAATADVPAVLTGVCTAITAALPVGGAVLLVIEPPEGVPALTASDARARWFGEVQQRVGMGPLPGAVRTWRAMRTADLTRIGPPTVASVAGECGFGSSLVLQLEADGERVGVLQALGEARQPVEAAQAEVLRPLLDVLSARLADIKALRSVSPATPAPDAPALAAAVLAAAASAAAEPGIARRGQPEPDHVAAPRSAASGATGPTPPPTTGSPPPPSHTPSRAEGSTPPPFPDTGATPQPSRNTGPPPTSPRTGAVQAAESRALAATPPAATPPAATPPAATPPAATPPASHPSTAEPLTATSADERAARRRSADTRSADPADSTTPVLPAVPGRRRSEPAHRASTTGDALPAESPVPSPPGRRKGRHST